MYLTIIRGLPGSGKSELADAMARALGAVHVEADQFYTIGEEYRFAPELRGEAHAWAQGQTAYALLRGQSVVVANTFTTMEEVAPYVALARRYNAILQVVTVELPEVAASMLAARSEHNVPTEVVEKMQARWQPVDVSALYVHTMKEK
jgi:predicted kinase